MLRLWFNRNYATTWQLIRMIRDNPDGVAVHVLGSHTDPDSPMLAACDEVIEELDLPAGDYVAWALDVARQHGIDVAVPRHLMADLAASRSRFAEIGTALLCPDVETVRLFEDKARGYAAAEALGVPVPPHRVVRDGAGLRSAYAEFASLAAQVCMKPLRGAGGAGFRRLTTEPLRWHEDYAGQVHSLVRVADAALALDAADPHEMLVMLFLDGPEISVDVLADDAGEVHAAIGRAHLGRRREIRDDPVARDIAQTLVAAHRVAYLSNTQVRYWNDSPYLLELNTRPAGGLFQTALADVNLPWAAICLATGRPLPPLVPRWGAQYATIASYAQLRPAR